MKSFVLIGLQPFYHALEVKYSFVLIGLQTFCHALEVKYSKHMTV